MKNANKVKWFVYSHIVHSSHGVEVLNLNFNAGTNVDAAVDLANAIQFNDSVDCIAYLQRTVDALKAATGGTLYVRYNTTHKFTLRCQRNIGEQNPTWYAASVLESQLSKPTLRALAKLEGLDDGTEAIARLKATNLKWINSASHYVVAPKE